MSVTAHDIGLEVLDGLSGYDSLCLFVAEDERPLRGASGYADWRLCGALSRVLMDAFFVGAEADTLLFPTQGRFPMPRIFVIGVGPLKGLTPERLGRVFDKAGEVLAKAGAQGIALEIPGEGAVDDNARVSAFKQHLVPKLKSARIAVLGAKPLAKALE